MGLHCQTEDKYCVWTKAGRRPTFFHKTLHGVEQEAARLASLQPGDKFIVMHVVSKWWVSKPPSPESVSELIEASRQLLRDADQVCSTALIPQKSINALRNALNRAGGAG